MCWDCDWHPHSHNRGATQIPQETVTLGYRETEEKARIASRQSGSHSLGTWRFPDPPWARCTPLAGVQGGKARIFGLGGRDYRVALLQPRGQKGNSPPSKRSVLCPLINTPRWGQADRASVGSAFMEPNATALKGC